MSSSPPPNPPPPPPSSSAPARASRKDRRATRAEKRLGGSMRFGESTRSGAPSKRFGESMSSGFGRTTSTGSPKVERKQPGIRRTNTADSIVRPTRSRRITSEEESHMLATKIPLKDLPKSSHGEEDEAAAARRRSASADEMDMSNEDLLIGDPKGSCMDNSQKTTPMGGASLRSCAQRFLDEDSDSDSVDLGMSMGLARYTTGIAQAKPAASSKTSSEKKSSGGTLDDHLGIRKNAINMLESISNSIHTMQSLKDLQMSFSQSMQGSGNVGRDDDSNSSDELVEFEDDMDDEDDELVSKNPFSKRQDLREVDQSCNLMDAETGNYEWSLRGSKKNKNRQNKSMIELFLGMGGSSGNGGRKPTKKQKRSRLSKLCNALCSKSFLCIVGVTAAFAILVAPLLWSTLMSSGTSNGGSTAAPTAAPTPLPTTVPQEETEETPSEVVIATEKEVSIEEKLDITNSPYFSAELVQERQKALEELLVSMDNADAVTDSTAAQKAMSWITAYDPAQLDILPFEDNGAENYGIMERYVLSVLFFTTNPQVPASTAPHMSISSRLRTTSSTSEKPKIKDEELNRRELFQLTFLDWMTAPHICSWQGITCDDLQFVVGIDLSNSKLHGTLPPELGLLMESLTEIDLSENRLQGPVPSGWGKFKALETLKLHENELTGTVDDDICGIESLVTFTTDCIDEVECDCCTKCY